MDLYVGNKKIQLSTTYPVTVADNEFYSWQSVNIIPWGDNNLFPNRLLETGRLNSVVNRVKAKLTNDLANFNIKGTEKDILTVKSLLRQVGFYKSLDQVCGDVAWFNGFSVQVLQENGFIKKLFYQSFAQVRSGILPLEEPADYAVAADWSIINNLGQPNIYTVDKPGLKEAYSVKRFKSFLFNKNIIPNPDEGLYPDWSDEGMLWYDYKGTNAQYYYPLTDLESVITEIELLESIVRFYKNSMQNGQFSSKIVLYPKKQLPNREQEEAEQKLIVENIMASASGDENAGLPMVLFYDNMGDDTFKPQIIDSPGDTNDSKWQSVVEIVQTQIFSALGIVSPEIFGFSRPSGFSSQAETLKTAESLFYQLTVKPRKKWLVENYIYPLIENLAISVGMPELIKNIEIDWEVKENITYTLEMVAAGVITIDEWRSQNNLQPFNNKINETNG